MTTPELIFGGIVLTGFAAFIVTLASVHLYTNLKPREASRSRQSTRGRDARAFSAAGKRSSDGEGVTASGGV